MAANTDREVLRNTLKQPLGTGLLRNWKSIHNQTELFIYMVLKEHQIIVNQEKRVFSLQTYPKNLFFLVQKKV